MARGRKTRRKTTRRRVSGINKSDVQVAIGVVLGAIGGSFANAQVAKMTKPLDPKIVAAVEILGGGFLASKGKSPIVKGIGFGFVATGANLAAKSLNIISGFRSLAPINGMRRVAGLADGGFISGTPARKLVSGANAAAFVKNNKFPSASVINGVNVNGHSDGSANF